MIVNPIIPIWLMAVISVAFLLVWRKGWAAFIRQLLLVILIFVINLRPMIKVENIQQKTLNMDVLFVIDNTISMFAEDMDHDARRMDVVKEDCEYIMDQLPGARYSVISFCNEAQRLTPYTTDREMVMLAIESLNATSKYYAQGTELGVVPDTIKDAIDGDGENAHIVFFISDGESNAKRDNPNFEALRKYIDSGAVLGYGTKQGGPMQVYSYYDSDDTEYLYYYDDDNNYRKAISKIDERSLKDIATAMGLTYVHMEDQNDIDAVLGEISSMRYEFIADGETTEGYADIYFYFLIPLVVILGVDCICIKRKL